MDPVVSAHLDWLRLRGMAEPTVWARRRALTYMARLLPGPLLQASPQDLLAWRQGLRLAPNSVISYVSHARQFFAWAAAQGLVGANPAEGLPVPRKPRMIPRPIGEAELLGALAAARPRIRPWLVLAAWAGLRAKEIAWLRREHVLTEPPLLMIGRDGAKGGHERLIPMSVFVLAELAPVLPRRGWVFLRADRTGPNTAARVSHLANAHLRACGSPATLHQLRHRFATQAYRADRDLRAVQELLGHRRPETTAGYAAYDPAAAAAAVAAIPVPRPRKIA